MLVCIDDSSSSSEDEYCEDRRNWAYVIDKLFGHSREMCAQIAEKLYQIGKRVVVLQKETDVESVKDE